MCVLLSSFTGPPPPPPLSTAYPIRLRRVKFYIDNIRRAHAIRSITVTIFMCSFLMRLDSQLTTVDPGLSECAEDRIVFFVLADKRIQLYPVSMKF